MGFWPDPYLDAKTDADRFVLELFQESNGPVHYPYYRPPRAVKVGTSWVHTVTYIGSFMFCFLALL